MLNKLVSILLTLVFAVNTIGVPVYEHFCHIKGYEVTFFSDYNHENSAKTDDCCEVETQEADCCEAEEQGCCEHKEKFYQDTIEGAIQHAGIDIKIAEPINILYFCTFLLLILAFENTSTKSSRYPPPQKHKAKTPNFLFFRNLRI